MTDEAITELNRKIAVMEASKTEDIQSRSWHGQCVLWEPCPDPVWDWRNFDYRVKADEPRRIFVPAIEGILYDSHFKNLAALQEFVYELKYKSHYSGYVEFVEVTPEVKQKLNL